MDPRHPHALRGIGLMVLAVSAFACLDTMSKVLVSHYPAPALVWARYILQTLVMLAIFLPRMGWGLMRTGIPVLQVARGLVLTGASVIFVLALGYMPVAEVSSIAFVSPILVALAAGPLLGERLRPVTWLSLAGGFAGVLLIIRPGSAVFSWAAMLPLGCAFCFAGYQILTRKMAGRDHPVTTLFYPGVVACVVVPAAFPGSAFDVPTTPLHVALLVAIGVLGAVGHFLLIRAHELATATLLAPFSYAQLAVIIVLGWLVFGHLPDATAFAGIALVAASGLAVVLSSRRPLAK